jgi:hypothetical protein
VTGSFKHGNELQGSIKMGNLLITWATVIFSLRPLHHGDGYRLSYFKVISGLFPGGVQKTKKPPVNTADTQTEHKPDVPQLQSTSRFKILRSTVFRRCCSTSSFHFIDRVLINIMTYDRKASRVWCGHTAIRNTADQPQIMTVYQVYRFAATQPFISRVLTPREMMLTQLLAEVIQTIILCLVSWHPT